MGFIDASVSLTRIDLSCFSYLRIVDIYLLFI